MAELQLILWNNMVQYIRSHFFLTIRAFSKHILCKHDPEKQVNMSGHSNLLMTSAFNNFIKLKIQFNSKYSYYKVH